MIKNKYERKIYLSDIPREKALEQVLSQYIPKLRTMKKNATEAIGSVTSKPIYAKRSVPHYHASAMDGIAVIAERTFEANDNNPLQLKKGHDFCIVDTGNEIKSPFNAVIMIENVQEIDEDTVEIIEPATPWQHIRPIGEDMVQGEMLFTQGHKIRPVDLGVLLSSGNQSVEVVLPPKVTIIPTGNELVYPSETIEPGKIVEFNGSVMAAFITEWGGNPLLHDIVKDNPDSIKEALINASNESDIVIINAGSSAGSKDYTVHIISEIGKVYTHGVATRPGKPVILGEINGTIVVGLPGYPVSAYLALEWFIKPLINKYNNNNHCNRHKINAKLGRRIVSTMGSEDFVRVTLGNINGELIANPLTRAAGVTMSLVKADGLLVVPSNVIGFEQGDYVEVELYKSIEDIEKSITITGSHDLAIDILHSILKNSNTEQTITSTHVGSMAGIMAIKKGEAHIAGIHLLDPETKTYNIPYVKKYLKDNNIVILPFVKRMQGWITPSGEVNVFHHVTDLSKKQIPFVNRQKGAGTRILFDLILRDNKLNPSDIIGYNREMFTHLSVAAEVAQTNSVGLGIAPAAEAMGCNFIPVAEESYDLLMTKEFFESHSGQTLYKIITSLEFKQEVEKISGYKVDTNIEPIYI
ncbi:MAG: molybdenum cofactor synthesis protein [Bacillales bacterium]|jgi:putative molybdopterin biosynthesis protein|nr:molybdenum cofactor synthesis protein [Bacillales bacterium]